MEYLMQAKGPTFKNFCLISYRAQKEILADLKATSATRPLEKWELRITQKIKANLKRDGITQKVLAANRKWDLDGKSFRRLLQSLGRESEYAYGFGSGSHFIHGDWYDLAHYHLTKRGRRYQPKLEFSVPDPRLGCSITRVCLTCILDYLNWSKRDPDKYVTRIAHDLDEILARIDAAHEETLTDWS